MLEVKESKILKIDKKNYQQQNSLKLLQWITTVQKEHAPVMNSLESGFIITVWSSQELNEIIERGGELFFLLDQYQKPVGYLLVSSVDEFLSQLQGNYHNLDTTQILQKKETWKYIYQIAVHKNFVRNGIGSLLLSYLKKIYAGTFFISDYMFEPYLNEASKTLFIKMNFRTAAELHLKSYRGFEPTKWQIVISD